MKRDKALMDILALENVIFHQSSDYLIAEPEDIAVRKVFTPYFRLWKQFLELRADRVQVMETPSFLGISIPE
jgi:deoxyribodipyrimidine photolyase